MDFKMDKMSYGMLAFILATMLYFLKVGAGNGLPAVNYFQMFLYGLLMVIILVALCCIPVLIYCYIVKKIPDIDYSVWTAFGLTIVGIISELF
jgi:hypothetical protein